jgi:tetratricopeptide (TPR) repeat protein
VVEPVPLETVALSPANTRGAEILRQAVQADMTGDVERALTLAEEAARIDPASASARSCLAGLYERLGRTEDAISQYEASLSLDPSNQLDLLRLRRLAPDRAALLSARAPRGKPRRWVAVAIAAACFLVVVGSSTAAYWMFVRPHRTGDESGQTVASADPATLVARARGRLLTGEPAVAETLLLEALRVDPTNADALAVLEQVRSSPTYGASVESQAHAEAGLPGLLFPGPNGTQATGAALGLAESLTAGLPATPPVPGSSTGIPPAAGFSSTPGETQLGAPPAGTFTPGLGGLPPTIGPNNVTPGNRIPSVDGGGSLLGNLQGGISNVFDRGPSSPGGGLRRPGVAGGTGGGLPPTEGGSDPTAGAGGFGPGNAGPIAPETHSGGSGSSISRAPGGSSVRPPGSAVPGSGTISVTVSDQGGTVRPMGGSEGGARSAWDIQKRALADENRNDMAAANRGYREAKAAAEREGGAAAAAVIKASGRGIERTGGG